MEFEIRDGVLCQKSKAIYFLNLVFCCLFVRIVRALSDEMFFFISNSSPVRKSAAVFVKFKTYTAEKLQHQTQTPHGHFG